MTTLPEHVILEVFRHHLWANQKLFQFCEGLTPGQLASSALGTYGSIYDTLRHIAVTEQWYLADIRSERRVDSILRNHQPSAPELRRHVEHTGGGLIEVVRTLTITDFARWSDRGQEESMLAVRLVIQTIDHAMEHRTQIRTILSQIGVTPPEVDGWAYDAAQPDKGAYIEDGARNS